jgi:hypothetical protein
MKFLRLKIEFKLKEIIKNFFIFYLGIFLFENNIKLLKELISKKKY